MSPMKYKFEAGEEVTLSCQDGYELTSPNKSVCGYRKNTNPHDFFDHMDRMNGYGQFSPRITSRTCSGKKIESRVKHVH